jgi:hypothetical protein
LFAILVLTPYVFAGSATDDQGACNTGESWYEVPGGWCVKDLNDGVKTYVDGETKCTEADARALILSATTEKKITDINNLDQISFTSSVWLRGDGFGWYEMKGQDANVFYHDTGYTDFKDAQTWNDARARDKNTDARMFLINTGHALQHQWDFKMAASDTLDVVCEVCTDESQCGREALTKLGPHQIEENQQDCPSGIFKTKSYKMCENCRCANHGSKFGAKVIDDQDNPRLACENMAIAAGASYYSFLKVGPGFRNLGPNKNQFHPANRYCQYDSRDSTGNKLADVATLADCETNQKNTQSSPAIKRPWAIYKLFNTCKTCSKVIYDEPCTNCKCSSVHRIISRKPEQQEKAASKQACAEKAYEAGFMYASYRDDDEKFCYFGHEKSTEDECIAGKRREGTKAPWSILEIQCLDEQSTSS